MNSRQPVSVDDVRFGLKRLRHGHGLARPTALLSALPDSVRAHLASGAAPQAGSAEEVKVLFAVLRRGVEQLSDDERLQVEVDFNLTGEHRYPTLTERQESMARALRCTAKTVRRHSDRALDTLAYLLLAGDKSSMPAEPTRSGSVLASDADVMLDELRSFWGLVDGAQVDIVCSEIPEGELPEYASPADRNYLRYAKFADLDTLIYLRTRFAQLAPGVTIRDFAPSEYYDTQADVVVVVGGPPWNATYREFLPQLPFHFEPHALGEDDPLVVPELNALTLGPRWTDRAELLEDLAVFTRLTLAQGTTVFLLGGCLTLGVLGSARCLLEFERGVRSVRYVEEKVDGADFVLITEARRIGGISDVTELPRVNPLLLLARRNNEPFSVLVDHTERYVGDRT